MEKKYGFFSPSLIFTIIGALSAGVGAILLHKETYENGKMDIADAINEAKEDAIKELPTEEEPEQET